MSLSERIRPGSEAAPWVLKEVTALEEKNNHLTEMLCKLKDALHDISLCSQNSSSSKEECGRIARDALTAFDEANPEG